MFFGSGKYLYHFIQKKIIGLFLPLLFSVTTQAQEQPLPPASLVVPALDPLIVEAYKKPARVMTLRFNPPVAFRKYVVRRGGELMHWPSYPLTTGQIIARNEDWLKRNNLKIGEQIASDIIKTNVNRLIYGRKTGPAVVPRF